MILTMISTANIRNYIFIGVLLLFFNCNTDDGVNNSCFPESTINVNLNLNLAAYQGLQQSGGWIYYNGELSGTRGLIIVNSGNGFKAYDRNAPHLCPAGDTTLEVESGLVIVCPNDGANWILTTGEPTAIANVPPVQYFTNFSGGVLSIFN